MLNKNFQFIKYSRVTKEIDIKSASLINILRNQIKTNGPITFPHYWQQSLLHEKFGYYMKQDVFNKEGDFVTSVEISQMFNEMIAIWLINTFQSMKVLDDNLQPKQKMHIMEFGPGLGTLSTNIFRVFDQFKLLNNLQYTYIEFSDFMKKKQQENANKQLQKHDINLKYHYDKDNSSKVEKFTSEQVELRWFKMYENFLFEEFGDYSLTGKSNTLQKPPVIVIAHEFFDALPVNIFEYHNDQWCEKMVGLDDQDRLQFILSNGSTEAVQKILKPEMFFSEEVRKGIKEGDTIEVSPQSQVIMNSLAEMISKIKGAALIVDYGEKRAFSNSVRGIQRHKIIQDYLNKPGDCDLSAYVNFMALEQAALKVDGIRVPEIMTQGSWLESMGISTRLQILCNNANKATEKKLQSEYERLVNSNQMGSNFKFMCVQNAVHGIIQQIILLKDIYFHLFRKHNKYIIESVFIQYIIMKFIVLALALSIVLAHNEELFKKLQKSEFGQTILETLQLELSSNENSLEKIQLFLKGMEAQISEAQEESDNNFQSRSTYISQQITSADAVITKAKEQKVDDESQLPLRKEELADKERQAADKISEKQRNLDKIAVLSEERKKTKGEFEERRGEIVSQVAALQQGKQMLENRHNSFVEVFQDLERHHSNFIKRFPNHKGYTSLVSFGLSMAQDPMIKSDETLMQKVIDIIDDLAESLYQLQKQEIEAEDARETAFQTAKTRLEQANVHLEGTVAQLEASVQVLKQRLLELKNDIKSQESVIGNKNTQKSDWNKQLRDEQFSHNAGTEERTYQMELVHECQALFVDGQVSNEQAAFIQHMKIHKK